MISKTTQPINRAGKNLLGIVWIASVFIAGCALSNVKDYQLNTAFAGTGTGCDQICWFGIQVGTTTQAQALEIIGKEAWIDQKTLKVADDTIKVEWFPETTKEFRSYTQLNLELGVVDSIEITGVMPFAVVDFINLLGEPDKIGITAWSGMHRESLTSYVLYYPTRSLEVFVAVGSSDGPQPTDYVSMIGTDLTFQGEAKQQPWSGYGQLDKYLAP